MRAQQKNIRTAGLVLAAGESSRFGAPKQLIKVAGEPLLLRVVRAALASTLDKTLLVLGFRAEKIIRKLGDVLANPKLSVVTNENYQMGMATSIRLGIAEIDESFDAAMIILGDFPLLNPSIIDGVLRAYQASEKGICLPLRDGRWGHPICLSRRYFNALRQIEGDIGAREIIRKNWSDVYLFTAAEDGCFFDLDTKEDGERLRTLPIPPLS